MACLIGSIEDLIVEDGEIKGQAKSDRVRWSQVSLSNLSGSLVCLKRLIGRGLALVANGELG
jgi:hypothetical protein